METFICDFFLAKEREKGAWFLSIGTFESGSASLSENSMWTKLRIIWSGQIVERGNEFKAGTARGVRCGSHGGTDRGTRCGSHEGTDHGAQSGIAAGIECSAGRGAVMKSIVRML